MPTPESDYQRIVDGIVAKIASGEYRPGNRPEDKLPSRSELAEEYATSVSTVDRAMTILHAFRLLRGHQGKGTWVASGAPTVARNMIAAAGGDADRRPERPD